MHYLVAALLALILGLAWSWRDRQRWRRELQWIWAHRKTAVAVLLLPAAAAFSLSTATYLLTGAAAMPPAMASAVPREYLLPMFIAIVVVAPVLEELLHRGVVFDLLSRRVGVIAAAGLGTALFVGMHFLGESGNVEPIRLVSLVAFSLAIYVVRVRCNSLVLCVLAHMLVNLIAVAAIALGTQA